MLCAYPARADLPWDEVEGRVFLALPRRRGALERWLARLVPVPENVLLSLEGEAARVWRLADGTRRLADLAAEVARHAPAAEADATARRAVAFTHHLVRRSLLVLQPEAAPARDARRGLGQEIGFRRVPCRACGVVLPLRAPAGARFLCPRCRRLNRVPR